MREILFGGLSQISIVWSIRDRSMCVDFGRVPELEEFKSADEIRPGTARIIGEPEAIRGEDQVVRADHAPEYITPSFSGAAEGPLIILRKRVALRADR